MEFDIVNFIQVNKNGKGAFTSRGKNHGRVKALFYIKSAGRRLAPTGVGGLRGKARPGKTGNRKGVWMWVISTSTKQS